MRTLCFAMAALSVAAWAQPAEPLDLGGVSSSGRGFDIELKAEVGPAGNSASELARRFQICCNQTETDGDRVTLMSHGVYDALTHAYFGYDLLIEKQSSDAYLLTFRKLSMSPLELVAYIGLRPQSPQFQRPSTNPADWTLTPLPSDPAPQTLRAGDVIRIDLLTEPATGMKLFETFGIRPRQPVRPVPAERPVPTVSGSAHEFTAADAELRITQLRLTLNGNLQNVPNFSTRGSLVWFYLPGRGRYILSLAPRPDLDFKLGGEVRGGAVTFTWGSDSIKLECPNPVATGEAPYNVYVAFDPDWEPTAQAQKGLFATGSVSPGELAALKRN